MTSDSTTLKMYTKLSVNYLVPDSFLHLNVVTE